VGLDPPDLLVRWMVGVASVAGRVTTSPSVSAGRNRAFASAARSTASSGSSTSRAWHDDVVASSATDEQRLKDLVLLRRVRDRIDRDYAQPLDVEALARGVHLSAGHLSREFKRAYGEPPYSYLMTRRIERAMALLRRGDLSVTDVCFEVGCSSLGTFSTRFTELVGISPSVYREQVAAGEAVAETPSCITKQVTRPIRARSVRNEEAPTTHVS
jgi:AraC-like DNA-binding protein